MAIYHSYELAASLSTAEWRRFLSWAERRAHPQDLRTLCAGLAAEHPGFAIRDEQLSAAIFPGKVFDSARMRVLRSSLKDALEQFMVEEALQAEPFKRDYLLLRSLLQRNLVQQAERLFGAMLATLSAAALGIEHMERTALMEEARLELFARKHRRQQDFDWERLLEASSTLALTHRLRMLCGMISGRGQGTEAQHVEAEECLREAHARLERLSPYTLVYYHLLSLQVGRAADPHFGALQGLLRDLAGRLSFAERLNAFGLLINLVLAMDQRGDPAGLPLAFGTYQAMHAQGLVFGHGTFSTNTARNIVSMGSRIGATEWTRAFLEEARTRLDGRDAENVYHFGAAQLCFVERAYGQAKQHLQQVDHGDPYYKLATDGLLLRIAYESGDEEMLMAVRHALMRHLHRKGTLRPLTRNGFRNLLQIIVPLFRLRWLPQHAGKPKAELAARRARYKALVYPDWVDAKLQELA